MPPDDLPPFADDDLQPPVEYTGASADDLADEAKLIEWIVEGAFATGCQYFLAGPAKEGKTFLAQHLACCVAEGKPFLGRTVYRRPVLFVALEGGRPRAARRWKQLGRGSTPDRTELDKRSLTTLFGTPEAPLGGYEYALGVARERDVLVIIDNFARAAACQDIDENDMVPVTKMLGAVEALLGVHSRASVLWIDHFRKAGDMQRGSEAKRAVVDGWLEMHPSQEEGVARIEATFRDARGFTIGVRMVEDDAKRLYFESSEAPARRSQGGSRNKPTTSNGKVTDIDKIQVDIDKVREFMFANLGTYEGYSTETLGDLSGVGKHRAKKAMEILETTCEIAQTAKHRRWEPTFKLIELMKRRHDVLGPPGDGE